MNFRLKEKIILKFGSQVRFAFELGEHEGVVSKVVKGWRSLEEDKKKKWADALGCKVEDIFSQGS